MIQFKNLQQIHTTPINPIKHVFELISESVDDKHIELIDRDDFNELFQTAYKNFMELSEIDSKNVTLDNIVTLQKTVTNLALSYRLIKMCRNYDIERADTFIKRCEKLILEVGNNVTMQMK